MELKSLGYRGEYNFEVEFNGVVLNYYFLNVYI